MRPFDSTGMDAAMSDQRVDRLTFDAIDPTYRGRKLRWITYTVWARGGVLDPPNYDRLPPTGRIMLQVHFKDGGSMGMREYLETEAANAVRKPKRRSR